MPERGYHLELITPVPLPRKPSGDLLRLPLRVRRAVRQTRAVLDDVDADVVIGFGGYVALPAYLAARGGPLRRRRVPVVVHEANASAGWANRVGARSARARAVGGAGSRAARRRGRRGAGARRDHLAGPDGAAGRGARTLRIRRRRTGVAGVRRLAGRPVGSTARSLRPPKTLPWRGISVLHAHGPKNTLDLREPADGDPPYVAVPYLDRMDLAYAAADLADLPVRRDDGRRGDRRRPARGLRARCRSATASSDSTRCPWSMPAAGSSSTTPT